MIAVAVAAVARTLVPVGRVGGPAWRLRMPAPLRVDQVVQLATVEEYAAALAALVDGHAAALVGAHGAAALRADEHGPAHGVHLRIGCQGRAPRGARPCSSE